MSLKIKRKYGILWYIHQCKCGRTNKIPLIILNIVFSFKSEYYHRCDCGYVSCLKNLQNIVIDSTDDKMKKMNDF